jgi:hypothetical protein
MDILIKKRYVDTNNVFNCPSCETEVGSIRYKYLQGDKESRIYHCSNCGLMFARPVLINELTHRQMDTVDDAELFNNPLLKKLHEKFIIKREIHAVKKIFPGIISHYWILVAGRVGHRIYGRKRVFR